MRVRLILGWLLVLSLVAAIGYAQALADAELNRTSGAGRLRPSVVPS